MKMFISSLGLGMYDHWIGIQSMQASVDMKENVYDLPLPVGLEVKKPNQKNEIFSSELNHNRRTTIAPPSSWATFDCKAKTRIFLFYLV